MVRWGRQGRGGTARAAPLSKMSGYSTAGGCTQGQKWAAVWDVNDTINLRLNSASYVSVMIYSSTCSDSAGLTRWSTHVASTSVTVPGAVRWWSENTASTPVTTPCWERSCAAVVVVSRRLRCRAVLPRAYVRWTCSTATNNQDTSTSGSSMTSSSTPAAAAEAWESLSSIRLITHSAARCYRSDALSLHY